MRACAGGCVGRCVRACVRACMCTCQRACVRAWEAVVVDVYKKEYNVDTRTHTSYAANRDELSKILTSDESAQTGLVSIVLYRVR